MTEAVLNGTAEVGELLPGDYNLDGSVDAADYFVWRDNASGLFTTGIGSVDYLTWANNYGSTFGGSALATPEPASASVVAAAFVLASLRRRSS